MEERDTQSKVAKLVDIHQVFILTSLHQVAGAWKLPVYKNKINMLKEEIMVRNSPGTRF